ncbi:MAG: RnfABCDGE type electron transport complex subunit B [Planctomycetia bacterium]|nr:RnfABCDGE type electron transport complex subunit B [Planctomycetia bacterium]
MEVDYGYLYAALAVLGALAVSFGVGLAFASRFFHIEVDPRQEALEDILPNVNCGACGFAGCSAYATALVKGDAEPMACPVGGSEVAKKIAEILGVAVETMERPVAIVRCRGSNVEDRHRYVGEWDCRGATTVQYGQKSCQWGCLGLGTCARACPFDAIVEGADGLPRILEDRCTACGACVKACPKNIIELLPRERYIIVLCLNREVGKVVRGICDVGCIACKRCEKICPVEGSAVHVQDNLAVVDQETCIRCGKCVAACPVSCIGNFRAMRKKKTVASSAEHGKVTVGA